jgi:polysaccharide export outer membrane protein
MSSQGFLARLIMRFGLAMAVVLASLVGGCSGYVRPSPAFHEVLNQPYRFDAGDRLRITVFDQPNLSNTYQIDASGSLAFPLIGSVPARGKTTDQLQADIAGRLRNGYLRHPDVTVEVEQYRPFFVMGEVRNAGQYPYVAGMTAQTAVAISGGYTARADQSSVDITRQINGEIMSGRVPVTDPIRPGDTLYVRERFF